MRRAFVHRGLPRFFAVLAAVLLLATIGGLVALWPDGSGRDGRSASPQLSRTQKAKVVDIAAIPCRVPRQTGCTRVSARVQDGPRTGTRGTFTLGETAADPRISIGDEIRIVRNAPTPAVVGIEATRAPDSYSFADFDRRTPMVWLAVAFCLIVVVFGRLRGAMSLVGLAISLAVVAAFIVPAILDGRSPVLVAVVGSMAVMLATILLAHGTGPKSLAAILGTAISLALTLGLAVLFTNLSNITGLSSEESVLLQVNQNDLSLQGLVLAGMVIGALGVLDDVTVSQASAVMALRRANPSQGMRELYRGALEVGRDHVAATVNTLVLAYVGASLPILLIFSVGGIPFADAVSKESVAIQIVATLVGSIGLISAVPATTALAALLASRLGADEVGDLVGGHAH